MRNKLQFNKYLLKKLIDQSKPIDIFDNAEINLEKLDKLLSKYQDNSQRTLLQSLGQSGQRQLIKNDDLMNGRKSIMLKDVFVGSKRRLFDNKK